MLFKPYQIAILNVCLITFKEGELSAFCRNADVS